VGRASWTTFGRLLAAQTWCTTSADPGTLRAVRTYVEVQRPYPGDWQLERRARDRAGGGAPPGQQSRELDDHFRVDGTEQPRFFSSTSLTRELITHSPTFGPRPSEPPNHPPAEPHLTELY